MQDTGQIPVTKARCKYLSASFHEQLDRDYGRIIRENGGHVTYTIRLDGEREPRFWEKIVRFLSGNN